MSKIRNRMAIRKNWNEKVLWVGDRFMNPHSK